MEARPILAPVASEPSDRPPAGPPARPTSLPGLLAARYRERRELVLGVVSVTTLLAMWEYIVGSGYFDAFYASKPSAIAAAGFQLFASGKIWPELGSTATGFAVGFVLATLIAVPMGILIGWYPTLYALTKPYIAALSATPRIALFPLFMVWLGIGIEVKILIVFISSSLPILFNTIGGMRSLDSSYIEVARCMGANDRQVLTTVALPASVPFIMTGLRIGVGHALLATIVAELLVGSAGLGALIGLSATYFQTAKLMFVILLVAAAGVVLLQVVQWVEEKVDFWRPHAR